ncbi:MAG: DNA translocase FtsK [Erysipelotrichaceae bacterium]
MAKKKQVKSNNNIYSQIAICVILWAIIIISIMKYGIVGLYMSHVMGYLFGNMYIFLLILFGVYALFNLVQYKVKYLQKRHLVAMMLFVIGLILYNSLDFDNNLSGFDIIMTYLKKTTSIIQTGEGFQSGVIGAFLFSVTTSLVDRQGTNIIIVCCFVIGLLISIDYKSLKERLNNRKVENKIRKEEKALEIDDDDFTIVKPKFEKPAQVKNIIFEGQEDLFEQKFEEVKKEVEDSEVIIKPLNSNVIRDEKIIYQLPPLSILNEPKNIKNNNNVSYAKTKGELLIDVLGQFGIPATLINTSIGPSVTSFELRPESGIKVSKIISLTDDIKMGLAARDIRIQAPIPGKNAIGVEIPNLSMSLVTIKEVVKNIKPTDSCLSVALGQDLSGKPVFCDLRKMPHLLVAGATGSGKSVCINSIISSLILRNSPDDVKLVLIDPKKVEFTNFANLPHLIAPLITDPKVASVSLTRIVEKMEQRYEIFAKTKVKNILDYNELASVDDTVQKMPFIVVVIDELADLMLVAGKEVESSIQRITQLARAAGIHLVVATQRPSVDVITGIIKANIPSRIAFAVSSGTDSRTILDSTGAERLLGNGDMLYFPIGENAPTRVQGVFVSDVEVVKLCDYVRKQCLPMYDDNLVAMEVQDDYGNVSIVGNSDDPLYKEAKAFVIATQKASASWLQRKFSIGYNRAAKLIDMLEEERVVGPSNGSKPREVYILKEEENE